MSYSPGIDETKSQGFSQGFPYDIHIFNILVIRIVRILNIYVMKKEILTLAFGLFWRHFASGEFIKIMINYKYDSIYGSGEFNVSVSTYMFSI